VTPAAIRHESTASPFASLIMSISRSGMERSEWLRHYYDAYRLAGSIS
jgi:hypothetical protein